MGWVRLAIENNPWDGLDWPGVPLNKFLGDIPYNYAAGTKWTNSPCKDTPEMRTPAQIRIIIMINPGYIKLPLKREHLLNQKTRIDHSYSEVALII